MAYVANTSINPLIQSMQYRAQVERQKRAEQEAQRQRRISAITQLVGTVVGAGIGGAAGGPIGASLGASLGGATGQTAGGIATNSGDIALQGATNLTNAAVNAGAQIAQNRQGAAVTPQVSALIGEYDATQQPAQAQPQAIEQPEVAPQQPRPSVSVLAQQQAAPQPAPMVQAQQATPVAQPQPIQQLATAQAAPMEQSNAPTVRRIDALLGLPAPRFSDVPAEQRTPAQNRVLAQDVAARAPLHEFARKQYIATQYGRTPNGGRSMAELEQIEQMKTRYAVNRAQALDAVKSLSTGTEADRLTALNGVQAKKSEQLANVESRLEKIDKSLSYAETGSQLQSAVKNGTVTTAEEMSAAASLMQLRGAGAINEGDIANLSGYGNNPVWKLIESVYASNNSGDIANLSKVLLGLGDTRASLTEVAKQYNIKIPKAGRLFDDDVALGVAKALRNGADTAYNAQVKDLRVYNQVDIRPYNDAISISPIAGPVAIKPGYVETLIGERESRYNKLVPINMDTVPKGEFTTPGGLDLPEAD